MQLLNNIFVVNEMQVDADQAKVSGVLNPEHPIFAAHFPGQPILPGVCQVRIATELLRAIEKKHLQLSTAKNIKYIGLITPDNKPVEVYFANITRRDDGLDCRVVFQSGGEVLSKMSLSYSL